MFCINTICNVRIFCGMLLSVWVLSTSVQAQDQTPQLHAFFAADAGDDVVTAVSQALSEAGGKTVTVFQPTEASNNQKVLKQMLKQPSDGFLIVLDQFNSAWFDNSVSQIIAQHATPVVMVGLWADEQTLSIPHTAVVGTRLSSFVTALRQQLDRLSTRDALCLSTTDETLCRRLADDVDTNMMVRSIDSSETRSVRWATAVSAMTLNPDIKTIVVTDMSAYSTILGALRLIRGQYVLISTLNPHNLPKEIATDTSLPANSVHIAWYLQTALALQMLKSHAQTDQWTHQVINIAPVIKEVK